MRQIHCMLYATIPRIHQVRHRIMTEEEKLKQIIALQDEELSLLSGAIKCMAGDAPCVALVKEAMKVKEDVDDLKNSS